MLSLKNVKSPDSNFVNFPKVGAYGGLPQQGKYKAYLVVPETEHHFQKIQYLFP